MSITCVALAGGISSRFGGDKLTTNVGGRPVLTRVLNVLGEISDEVYLSVSSESQAKSLAGVAPSAVRLILDDDSLGFGGPAAGICTSLLKIKSDSVLFVPADIPWVDAISLRRLVRARIAADSQVGTIFWDDGTTENLVQSYHNSHPIEEIREMAHARSGVFRATDFLRGVKNTLYVDGSLVAETSRTFSDVDTREDLLRPLPKSNAGRRERTIEVGDETKRKYRKGAKEYRNGKFEESAMSFILESKDYSELGLQQIASHCILDAAYSARRGGVLISPLVREAGLRPRGRASVQRFIRPPRP